MKDEEWNRVFEVNLHGAARLTNLFTPQMAARGANSVILMSSIAGLQGNRAIGLYGRTKAAIAQLTRNLAAEWGPPGMRVNAVSPGLSRTPLSAEMLTRNDFMQRRLSMTDLTHERWTRQLAGS